jgi:hypothetical protein
MKFNITKEQIEMLKPHLKDLDKLLQGSLDDFLDALDSAMLDSMDGDDFSIETEASILVAKLYDQILAQNEE